MIMKNLLLSICLLDAGALFAGAPCQYCTRYDETQEESGLRLMLTKYEVTGQRLELQYKTRNNTDHDIWLCDSAKVITKPEQRFEVYMAEDGISLLIRKRHDVPLLRLWFTSPRGRYIRLPAGQEHIESISLTLPIQPVATFSELPKMQEVVYARRLVLEIGYYLEDLPEMIRGIIAEAERIGCSDTNLDDGDYSIHERYFEGLLLARFLKYNEYFRHDNPKDATNQVTISYTDRLLKGEHCSRIVINGIFIPYGEEGD